MTGCPRCKSQQIHQSRRKGIVERKLLTLLFLRPFRCESCDFRFYRRLFSADSNSPRTAAAN